MIRIMAFSVLFLTMVGSSVRAVPAKPLYEPPPPPPPAKAPVSLDLRGSAWLGKYLTTNRTFIFEQDGTLSYRTTTKTTFKNRGIWRVEGNVVIFEHYINPGNKLMEFRGTIRDGNTIEGESVTRTGAKSKQTLQRTAPLN